MKDLGHFRIEPHVEGYSYKKGTMVEKEDGLYRTVENGLKKIFAATGPDERMVTINRKVYFELEEEKPTSGEEGKTALRESVEDIPEAKKGEVTSLKKIGVIKTLKNIINLFENMQEGMLDKEKQDIRFYLSRVYNRVCYLRNQAESFAGKSFEFGSKGKPPLGIKPKPIHDQERSNDLVEAIERYLSAGKQIPLEWIEEFNEFFK